MKIDISSMTHQTGSELSVSYDGPADGFESANPQARFTGTLHLEGQLRHIEHGMFGFNGRITVPYHANCDRCLAEIDRVLETDFREVFVRDQGGPVKPQRNSGYGDFGHDYHEEGEGRNEDEEEDVFSYQGQAIDLTEAVQQNLILAMPNRILCREDCRGLCPVCGQNLNDGSCNCRREAEGDDDSPFAELRKLL